MNRIMLSLTIISVITLQRTDGAEFLFGAPEELGAPVNSPVSDYAHVSASGTSIYVMRGIDGGDVYAAERSDTGEPWGPLQILW